MRAQRFRSRKCERARELASLRLDCQLSELEEALLEAHLERCADCSAFALDIGGFTRELRAAPVESPGYSIGLPRRPAALRRAQFVAAAAAVAVVVGAASMFTMLGSPAGQTRQPSESRSLVAGNLAQVRNLRRKELVFTSRVFAPAINEQRILRLS